MSDLYKVFGVLAIFYGNMREEKRRKKEKEKGEGHGNWRELEEGRVLRVYGLSCILFW
jgi:hypothetical protein